MLNVHDLERRWLRYKIKTYTPIALGGIVFIVILSLGLSTLGGSTEETVILEPQNEVAVVKNPVSVPQPVQNVPVQTAIDVPQNTQYTHSEQEPVITQRETKSLVLRPSLHFMDNIEEGLNPYLEDELPIDDVSGEETRRVSTNNSKNSYNNSRQTQKQTPRQTVNPPKRGGLVISTKKNEKDLKDVIRRFKKNKNPALSLFVAKRYYELGKYQKSYNYALMTNEINKEIDDSWIIFAKSLVKLNQKDLAILTLKSYLKSKKSTQAEVLLRKIQAGTFK